VITYSTPASFDYRVTCCQYTIRHGSGIVERHFPEHLSLSDIERSAPGSLIGKVLVPQRASLRLRRAFQRALQWTKGVV